MATRYTRPTFYGGSFAKYLRQSRMTPYKLRSIRAYVPLGPRPRTKFTLGKYALKRLAQHRFYVKKYSHDDVVFLASTALAAMIICVLVASSAASST